MRRRIYGWKLFMVAAGPLVVLAFFGASIIRIGYNPWAKLFGAFLTGSSTGLLIGGFSMYYEQMKSERIILPKPKVSKPKAARKNPLILKLSKGFPGSRMDLLSAGIAETPSLFYYKWAQYLLYTLLISVPLAFILAFVLRNPLPLAILLAPFVMVFAPSIQIRSSKGERRKAVDDELPFFALYSATLADAGISLYSAFKKLLNQNIFRTAEKDALYLIRAVEFLGQDHITALDALAKTHPSKIMSDLLYGYTSELRSGGDVSVFLMGKAEELLKWLEFRFEKYGDSVSDIGEMITALFFILPTLVLAMAFISPNTAMMTVWLMDALVIPVLGVVIIFQIRAMQPRTGTVYEGNVKGGLIAGAVTGALVFILKAPYWAVMSSALAAGTLGYSTKVFFQKRTVEEEENSLEPFMRDVTELRKAGHSIPKAIEKLAHEGKYARSFTELLKSVSARLQLGFRLSDLSIGSSWIGRQVFFLLGQIDDTGGGSARELENVHAFIERYAFAKRAVKSRMKIYQFLMIFTPAGLALLIFVMSSMISMMRFSPFMIPSGLSLGAVSSSPQGIAIPSQLFQASYVMVVIASAFMSLSSTVASDFTLKNMWRVSLTVLLASLAIFIFTTYGTLIVSHAMPSVLFLSISES